MGEQIAQKIDHFKSGHFLFRYVLNIIQRVRDLKRTGGGDRPVVLVGWGVGAAINCQVAVMEPVAAIVCLGKRIENNMSHVALDSLNTCLKPRVQDMKTFLLFFRLANVHPGRHPRRRR